MQVEPLCVMLVDVSRWITASAMTVLLLPACKADRSATTGANDPTPITAQVEAAPQELAEISLRVIGMT